MITPADFKVRFPEFSEVDDERIQLFIDDAIPELSESVWGNLYDKGLAYLSAHFLTLGTISSSGDSGSLNALASHSVEGVSESFAVPNQDSGINSSFNSTKYGQEYYRLLKLLGIGAVYGI